MTLKLGGDLHSYCFTFGCGDQYRCGHGNCSSFPEPKLVEGLADKNTVKATSKATANTSGHVRTNVRVRCRGVRITAVAAGGYHTAVVAINGDVWVWGSNDAG